PIRLLSRKLKPQSPLLVAVLNFTYSRGRMSTGSYLVSERLVTYLVQNGVTVVERRLLQKLLEERKFCETGAVDPGSLRQVGQVLGADAVVAGTLTDLTDDTTEIMARLIRVDTAKILAASSIV